MLKKWQLPVLLLLLLLLQLGKLLKTTYRSAFVWVCFVEGRIRKHDGVLSKICKLRYCFLVKQQKEASELKSIYRFNFFIIDAKYNRIDRAETQLTYLQQFYIYSFGSNLSSAQLIFDQLLICYPSIHKLKLIVHLSQ